MALSNNNINNNNNYNSNDGCGYDENLFISPPPDHFRCGICSFVIHNPVLIIDCGHKYCFVCFERLKASTTIYNNPLQCPVDRNMIHPNRVFEDVALKREVGNLQVRCQGSEKGCNWNGELSELEVHVSKCQYLCPPIQQQLSFHNVEIMGMVHKLTERVDKNEMEGDKELSHLKYTVQGCEQEIKELKQVVDEVCDENRKLKKEVQQNKEKGSQQFTVMETKLGDALESICQLVKKVEEVENKNKQLEVEVGEAKIRGKLLKEIKVKANLEKCALLENKGKHLDELLEVKKTKEDVAVVLPKYAPCSYNRSSQQQQLQPKVLLMQPRSDKDRVNVEISSDNRIYLGGLAFSTFTLVSGEVGRGRKAFYEVDVVTEGGSYDLHAGWASNNFTTSEYSVGRDQHSFSYVVHSTYSCIRHNGTDHPYGKCLVEDGQNIIGVALNMNSGQMLFGFNGKWDHPMGMAFDKIDTNKNFFPAISYGDGTIQVNFGERDFVHGPPDESFASVTDIV